MNDYAVKTVKVQGAVEAAIRLVRLKGEILVVKNGGFRVALVICKMVAARASKKDLTR